MKIKFYFSIVVFLLAFAISGVISKINFESQEITGEKQKQVFNLLKQNRLNILTKINKLKQRNYKISGKDSNSFVNPLKEYGEAAEKLNDSNLPEDFRGAWKRYATTEREWVDFLNHLESMPDELSLNPIEKQIADEKIANEKATWNEVVKIAKKYSVEVSADGNVNLKTD